MVKQRSTKLKFDQKSESTGKRKQVKHSNAIIWETDPNCTYTYILLCVGNVEKLRKTRTVSIPSCFLEIRLSGHKHKSKSEQCPIQPCKTVVQLWHVACKTSMKNSWNKAY
jgi:hypothetical protein